jgi:hypothetical protein
MKNLKIGFVICLFFLALPGQATEMDWRVLGGTSLAIAGAAAGVWFGIPPPKACQWCEPSRADSDATQALQWEDPDAANLVSNIVGYGIVPAISVASVIGYSASDWERFGYYSLVVIDAALLELFITEWMKKGIARQRPESFYNQTDINPKESYVSFPSGHTSLAFTLAGASWMIAHHEKSVYAPVVGVAGSLLSAFTGYLRIAALKHWISDVFVGGAIGALTGVLLPMALLKTDGETLAN